MIATKESPEALALRARPRPVTRLNRRMLAVLVGLLAGGALGVTMWSLESRRNQTNATIELHNVDRIAHAEGFDQLPANYSKIVRPTEAPPVLGAPLPGDLGGALLQAERQTDIAPTPAAPVLRPDPVADEARAERINRQREAEEAAKAGLFFRSATHKDSAVVIADAHVTSSTASTSGDNPSNAVATTSDKPAAGQGDQVRKQAFLESLTPGSKTLQLKAVSSPYTVMAGTTIPAALVTGINSDLPGQAIASITENVYDTATGRYLLIPQGSRLLGQYDSQIAFGQRRVLLVWTRLVMPDASSITLERLPGVDAAGYAGLQDGVDWHWKELGAAAVLSTLIGVGAELAAPDRSNGQTQVVIATRQSVQDTINQAGQEITRRSLSIQPTLTIRAGMPVRVIVNRDLVLRLYAFGVPAQ
jgi:type IV secretion system protein VirB10